jgi:EAL domain-containing protein (putative c-di-GMP-specific phosphodiesterase class I)
MLRNLARLRQIGCGLDMDDFGTGHASIAALRQFGVSRIKIARSFVTRLDEDPDQRAMVRAILTLGRQLGLATLAEGVETEGERAILEHLGCGEVQGFGLARPMPRAALETWLRHRPARAAATAVPRSAPKAVAVPTAHPAV